MAKLAYSFPFPRRSEDWGRHGLLIWRPVGVQAQGALEFVVVVEGDEEPPDEDRDARDDGERGGRDGYDALYVCMICG